MIRTEDSPRSPAFARAVRNLIACAFFGASFGACAPALAIQPVRNPEIIVTAPLPKVAPERVLDGADVESYGLGTVGEVLSEVAAEDGERSDEAVFLVNGKRINGLGSIADLPAEAISGIEVLPRGSGPALGVSPSRRIYQIRLRRNLDLVAARAAAKVATGGGWSSARGDLSYTSIRGPRRLALTAKARREDRLLESDRGIVQPPGVPADAGRFRSLSPASDRFEFALSAADQLTPWLSGSLGAKLSASARHALLGPFEPVGGAAVPLDQRSRSLAASVDVTLNAEIGTWNASAFANAAFTRGRTATDRPVAGAASPPVAFTRSVGLSIGGQINAFGPILQLPAGPLILNLTAGLSRDSILGLRRFQGVALRHRSTLTSTNAGAALEIPIAGRSAGRVRAIGDLSATAELNLQHSSDFGSFRSYTVSMLWRPADWFSLNGSAGRSGSAPPIASLDDPAVETPGVRYFDPLRGETVDVTLVTGGTSDLRRQRRETNRIAANLKPFRSLALRLTAEYFESRNRNYLSELPAGSLSIMQAFPQRFVRDPGGRLVGVDARPVVFASRLDRQLRTGLTLSLPLGRASGAPGTAAPDEDDNGVSLSRIGSTAGGGARPRLELSLSHAWLLRSALVIVPGQRPIDLLSRQAVGFGGLGQPRHRFDASLGYSERGLGARLSVQSRGPSFIESSGANADRLRFDSLHRFDLRAWIQGERLAPGSKVMKGSRITLAVTNVTNVRERVVDRFGLTPLAYQRGYRDPIGRAVEVEFRKKF